MMIPRVRLAGVHHDPSSPPITSEVEAIRPHKNALDMLGIMGGRRREIKNAGRWKRRGQAFAWGFDATRSILASR
jgi:hypothetical protein